MGGRYLDTDTCFAFRNDREGKSGDVYATREKGLGHLGGNDGIAFMHLGATNLPLSWPGRYSHSPGEVMDLRDLVALVDLIVALVEE